MNRATRIFPPLRWAIGGFGVFALIVGGAALAFELNNGFKLFHLHSSYVRQNVNYQKGIVDYRPEGHYFNYGVWASRYGERVRKSETGMPMVNYGGEFHFNPVTIAEYGLAEHGRWLSGERTKADVEKIARFLVSMQSPDDGAFRYSFSWKHYLSDAPFEPGWVSGMAQGQALSLFSRAYRLTGDESFLVAGTKSLSFLMTPIDEGGVMGDLEDIAPDASELPFFEEYVLSPQVYTLNGFIYAMIGLYDWSELPEGSVSDEERKKARVLFDRGILALERLTPFYDMGGWSTYDLGHVTRDRKHHVSARYHGTHVYQLHALARISGSEVLAALRDRWAAYLDPEQNLYHRVATWRYR